MGAINQFEQLRRDAYERGQRDYHREKANAAASGEPIWRNNPYQNNFATDEREAWDEAWDNEATLDADGQL